MLKSFRVLLEMQTLGCSGTRLALVTPVLLQTPLGGLVRLSTARTAAICFMLSTAPLSLAQAVTLTMERTEVHHGAEVRLKLLLKAPAGSAPAALQWEFKIPPDLQIAEIEPGEAVKKAGKTLVCNGGKCLVYGLNRTTIPNGQIAVAKIRAPQSPAGAKGFAQIDSQGRNREREVQIVDIVAASLDGKLIERN
jgi:hypothetical protein